MNCAKCQRSYFLSLDGDLSENEEKLMQGHLERCEACRAAIRRNRLLGSRLKEGESAPPEPLLREIRRKAQERLLSPEPETFLFIPGLPRLLPRLAYSAALVAAAFIFISILLSVEKQPRVARLETEIRIVRVPRETPVGFENIEKHFRDLYVAKARSEVKEAFSVIDRAASLAKATSEEYGLSFPVLTKHDIEEALEDLERRVKERSG